jgi:hypothetical protein
MNGNASFVLVTICMTIGCAPSAEPPTQASAKPVNAAAGAAAPGVRSPAAGSGGTAATTAVGALPPVMSPTAPINPVTSPSAAGAAAPPGAPPMATPPLTGAPPPVAAGGCKANAPCSHGTDPVIPEPIGDCPNMVSGPFPFMGATSQIWVGTKSQTQKGPIMLYWHGTGGTALTATSELDPTLVQEIMSQGGVIGSITEGLKGDTLDWGVFTTGDYQSADQIVACAVKQLNIDTKRIYSSGASAGGLAAGEIAYGRSQYMAATLPNSGGQGGYPMNMILNDPTHVPAAMTMHGARGVDVVVIDFGDSSLREDIDIAKKGGFAVDCDHGGGHVGAPPDLKAAGWDFLKQHPFGFGTSPYAAGLPASYPKYCQIVTKDTPMPMSMMTMGTPSKP